MTYWLVLLALALLFVATGIRRETVPFGPVVMSPDGRTLSFDVGACNRDAAASAEETADTVTLRVTADRAFCGPHDDCAGHAEVRLEDPLGEREVIDAATGQVVFVGPPGSAP